MAASERDRRWTVEKIEAVDCGPRESGPCYEATVITDPASLSGGNWTFESFKLRFESRRPSEALFEALAGGVSRREIEARVRSR